MKRRAQGYRLETTADDINPGVPVKGSIRVPVRGALKGFRV